jgi:predicted RNA-binding Zn ribbon-like protein
MDGGEKHLSLAATMRAKTAPGQLELVQRLLNTARPGQADRLADPGKLKGWLVRFNLIADEIAVQPGDVARVQSFRSLLRSFILQTASDSETEALNALVARVRPKVVFRTGAAIVLEGDTNSIDGALSQFLAIAAQASTSGHLKRLRLCKNPECGRTFYDRSKNNNGVWCSMMTCGNKLNARTYRTRKSLSDDE